MAEVRPRLAVAVLVVASLGCGGVLFPPPEVFSMTIDADRCGGWTATVDARGDGEALVVTGDGKVVGSFPIDGRQTITATGATTPGRNTAIEARIGDSARQEVVLMPSIDAGIAITPPGGVFAADSAVGVDVLLSTPCKVARPVANARLRPANKPGAIPVWTAADVPIGAGTGARLAIPAPPRGLYDLEIDAVSGDLPLRSVLHRFYWGAADDDLDRDGHIGALEGVDCDDHDAKVHPLAGEARVANKIDDNCDGRVDEGTTAYDDDGDGLCEDDGDCDDADATRYPGAPERADCRDQDCDAEIDEGVKLIEQDDTYEGNDSRPHAADLQTSREHSFVRTIDVVTRAVDDEEWFAFYSQDGDWDTWGIDADAMGIPDGSVYDVAIYGDGSKPLDTMRITGGSHDGMTLTGKPFRDDSGDYLLAIKPVSIEKPWCPVSIRLTSR